MHRFFIPPEWIGQSGVVITGEQAHQIKNVLRLKNGDRVIMLNNSGAEYELDLINITSSQVTGKIVEKRSSSGEPNIKITLYQSMLKGGKLDIVLQKCTEIGVTRFAPMICERTISRDPGNSRQDRWKKIIREAAEQSGRGKVPILEPILDFSKACENAVGISFLPWEEESELGIKSAISKTGKINQLNIFIGPEGGFTKEEIELARSHGIIPVTLGKRILRAETAGMVIASVICYENGEMGS